MTTLANAVTLHQLDRQLRSHLMLMVIFGAGASYDSAPVFAGLDEPFRPPLTKDLFTVRGDFDAALDAYPQFQTIGASLRQLPEGTTLERRLAELQAQSADIPERYRELMAVRFYLQQILWTTPHEWYWRSHRRSNYSTVIGNLRDWQAKSKESVALVTFNYDVLLDHAYAAAFDFEPAIFQSTDLGGYLHISNFPLFKPHGSVNWARRIQPNIASVPSDGTGPAYLIRHAADVRPTGDFEIISLYGQTVSRVDVTSGLVPALALPLEAKSVFECPERHKYELMTCIPEVTRLVTIGWRASEHTFLELWQERANPDLKIHIVSPGDPAGVQTNLVTGGIRGAAVSMSKMAFTDFAEHGGLATLLQSW